MTGCPDRPTALIASLALIMLGCGGGGSAEPPAPAAPADTTPPRITQISGISNGDMIFGAVSFAASATDDTGIASFSLSIAGEQVIDAPRAEITYTWDVRQIQGGPYELAFAAADAAGNTDTETIDVIAISDDMPPDWEPEPEPAPEEKLSVQPLHDFDYVLPPMDPSLYNPDDKETPTLLLVGIRNGEVVHDTCEISATATDDTGVNVITLLVDGHQLAIAEGCGLRYEWDTTPFADGEHTVTFVVRDNGANVGQCSLEVTVDNTTEHNLPVVTLTGFDSMCITGIHRLRVVAEDESGVEWVKLALGHRPYGCHGQDGPDSFEISATGSDLVYDWDTRRHSNSWFIVFAEAMDNAGNHLRERVGYLYTVNYYTIHGEIEAPSHQSLGGVLACLLRPDFAGDYTMLPNSDCIESTYSSEFGAYALTNVPFGEYKFCLYADGYRLELDLALPPILETHPTVDLGDHLRFDPRFGERHSTGRSTKDIAIVWGADDRIDEILRNKNALRWVDLHLTDREWFDGSNMLDEQYLDFIDVLTLERDTELLWYLAQVLVIDSGIESESEILGDPTLADALKHWVMDGGRLVVIGRSYDFVEQLWPGKIDFAGSTGIDGLDNVPEQMNAAEVGPGWLDTESGRTACAICYVRQPAVPRNVMHAQFDYQYWTYPWMIAQRFDELEYDEAADIAKLQVHGLIEGWPVVEGVADDVAVWMTLEDDRLGQIRRGTPVQLGFSAGLGLVVFASHLMCDGNDAYTPQANSLFERVEAR